MTNIVAIAQREVSMEPVAEVGAVLASGTVPGAGRMGGSRGGKAAGAGGSGQEQPAAAAGGVGMSGGM